MITKSETDAETDTFETGSVELITYNDMNATRAVIGRCIFKSQSL